MDIEVYCDEAYPDLLSSRKSNASFLTIGSLWVKREDRDEVKQKVHHLRDRYCVGVEFKWQKVSPSRLDFYQALVDLFFEFGERLRFRCIAVDRSKADLLRYHEDDQELGFYKFYYQLLHHWILDFNDYAIFCDFKSNRLRDRLHVLKRCLQHASLSSHILTVQAVRSKESVLIQFADLLVGAVSARFNDKAPSDSSKGKLVELTEQYLGHLIRHTPRSEQKFNVFVIDLEGGW